VVLVSARNGTDRVDLVVQDDGLGGSFEVANGEDGGLTVRVSLPLRRFGVQRNGG
jgi:hypothetical protein